GALATVVGGHTRSMADWFGCWPLLPPKPTTEICEPFDSSAWAISAAAFSSSATARSFSEPDSSTSTTRWTGWGSSGWPTPGGALCATRRRAGAEGACVTEVGCAAASRIGVSNAAAAAAVPAERRRNLDKTFMFIPWLPGWRRAAVGREQSLGHLSGGGGKVCGGRRRPVLGAVLPAPHDLAVHVPGGRVGVLDGEPGRAVHGAERLPQ